MKVRISLVLNTIESLLSVFSFVSLPATSWCADKPRHADTNETEFLRYNENNFICCKKIGHILPNEKD